MTNTPDNNDILLQQVTFNEDGLVPVIAQQHDTGEVLMMAWMNRDALLETVATGRMCYWSRSRSKLWRKGEDSAQYQQLKELIIDCDGDTLLAKVDQTGVACHTGRRSCFFSVYKDGKIIENARPLVEPGMLYASKE